MTKKKKALSVEASTATESPPVRDWEAEYKALLKSNSEAQKALLTKHEKRLLAVILGRYCRDKAAAVNLVAGEKEANDYMVSAVTRLAEAVSKLPERPTVERMGAATWIAEVSTDGEWKFGEDV